MRVANGRVEVWNFAELAGTLTARLSCDYPPVASAVDTDGEGMVAKDYPFYLVLNRSSCSVEVQTLSGSLAKEVEVGLRVHILSNFHYLSISLSSSLVYLSLGYSLFL